jgi:protease II
MTRPYKHYDNDQLSRAIAAARKKEEDLSHDDVAAAIERNIEHDYDTMNIRHELNALLHEQECRDPNTSPSRQEKTKPKPIPSFFDDPDYEDYV